MCGSSCGKSVTRPRSVQRAAPRRVVDAPPAFVRGSRDELRSAFGNLVSNAIRYTPDGGQIELRWREE